MLSYYNILSYYILIKYRYDYSLLRIYCIFASVYLKTMLTMQFFKHYIGLFFAVIIVISLSGCRNHSMTSELVYIDSLISDNNIDEALMRLRGLDINSFDQESTAYYTILLTLAKYKNFEEISSDSAINEAVDYFRSHNQQPRLKYSLIAKGCAEDVLGKPDESIKCFHEAELITCTGGIQQDAYIKLRLADLYHTQYIGSDTLAVQKYHAAYQLYKKLHDAHYQTICLGEIGGIYSDIPSKSDSALYYINSAISLAEQTHDDYYLFANYYSKSLYYLNTINDFTKAKESALKAISYTNEIDHPRAHYCLSASYVHLNKIDSSIYYLKLAPEPKSTIDSISYLNVLSQIEEFYHHEDKSRAYFKRSNSLADSSLIKSLSHRLLEVEKKYDLQQEELKNVSLQSKLKGAWLTIAVTLLAALMLYHFLWRYRNRLRAKENEYNNLKEEGGYVKYVTDYVEWKNATDTVTGDCNRVVLSKCSYRSTSSFVISYLDGKNSKTEAVEKFSDF